MSNLDVFCFDVQHAIDHGVKSAIILNFIQSCVDNDIEGKIFKVVIIQNRYYVRITIDQFLENLPFFSKSQILTNIKRLKDHNAISIDRPANSGMDKANYYSVNQYQGEI